MKTNTYPRYLAKKTKKNSAKAKEKITGSTVNISLKGEGGFSIGWEGGKLTGITEEGTE